MLSETWKVLLSFILLIAIMTFASVALAQESSTAAPAPAVSTSHSRAAAAFATPAAKPSTSAVSEGPDPDRKWEFEVHGGGILTNNPTGGTAALPGPGAPFTTLAGQPSRAISSYYFGDGALLFNQFIAAAGPCAGVCTPITPLDGVLTTRTADRAHGGAFGFRLSREITRRWTVEANFDYNIAPLELSRAGLTGIETTRASWAAAWTNMLGTTAATVTSISSAAAIRGREGRQIFGTVGVNVNLLTERRVIPYLSFGGGALANVGDLPSAALLGNLQFSFFGAPHNNTDSVLVNWGLPEVQGVGYFGGGVKYYVTRRWGFRLDVRDYLSGHSLRQYISASPLVATLAPADTRAGGINPDIQFSNNPPGGPDTLSGPALNRFRTFTSDGVRHQVAVTGGIFFRF